jgi:mRNA-degrading endonuclease RelE of RelBE toxin-antitoxin system
MKEIVIQYSKSAQKFITKNSNLLTLDDANALLAKATRKVLHYEENNADVIALHGGLRGSFLVRTGNIRMIFSLHNGVAVVVAVEAIGFRGGVY